MEMLAVKENQVPHRGYQGVEEALVVLEVIGQIQRVEMVVVEKTLYHILELMLDIMDGLVAEEGVMFIGQVELIMIMDMEMEETDYLGEVEMEQMNQL